MLFRIEDSENYEGIHRDYYIETEDLPRIHMYELDKYISNEIRKEVNGAADRRLLSYSKSLGVCLLKYNKYADNEIHINCCNAFDYLVYYDIKNQTKRSECYSLDYAILGLCNKNKKREIAVCNFVIDVSNNELLDKYLKIFTGVGRKKIASPEKDKEVLLFQSPYDFVIKQYSDSVYLLYALVIKYGMRESIYYDILDEIDELDEFRFYCCESDEREGLKRLVGYLYYNQEIEREMSTMIIIDSYNSDDISCYYDPITQFHDIQKQWFSEVFALSDYNDNVVSDCIWRCYSKARRK